MTCRRSRVPDPGDLKPALLSSPQAACETITGLRKEEHEDQPLGLREGVAAGMAIDSAGCCCPLVWKVPREQ